MMPRVLIAVMALSALAAAPGVRACDSPLGVAPAPNSSPSAVTSSAPIPLIRIQAPYPALARIMGVEGDVTIRFIVRADGSIGKASVMESKFWTIAGSSPDSNAEAELEEAAIKTLKQWKFEPYRVDGKPQTTTACQTFHFKIKTR